MIVSADAHLLVKRQEGKASRRISRETRDLIEERRQKRDEIDVHGATKKDLIELENISVAVKDSIIAGIMRYKNKVRLQLALRVMLFYFKNRNMSQCCGSRSLVSFREITDPVLNSKSGKKKFFRSGSATLI